MTFPCSSSASLSQLSLPLAPALHLVRDDVAAGPITVNQRWRERRDSYRPAGEVIDTRAYEVAPILDDATAKRFVQTHHYSGSYPAARYRYGLYRRAELVGVAVFSHPCNDKVLESVFHRPAREAVELGRFVLLDDVEGNGETWFLARAFADLRQHVVGVVSFSDPIPRTTVEGEVVMPGHVGTIYQASNAVFLGRGAPARLNLLPDGRILAPRSLSKIRNLERGWRSAAELLERYGADPVDEADPAGWLRTWLPQLTRPLIHPGNYKYAWGFEKAIRKALPASLPYPKHLARAA